MTTYDEIWKTFLAKCKVNNYDLPQTPEKIYGAIESAILDYNNRLQSNIVADNTGETISEKLDSDHLLLLSRFIKLNFLRNQEIFFTNTWQPFGKDIGLKNFSDQLRSIKELVKSEEKVIDATIANFQNDYM